MGTGVKVEVDRECPRKRPTEEYSTYSDRASAEVSREAPDIRGRRPSTCSSAAPNRVLRPSLGVAHAPSPPMPTRLRKAVDRVDAALKRVHQPQDIAA